MTNYTMRRPQRLRASAVSRFPDEFVVMAGSEARLHIRPSLLPGYEHKRRELVEDGSLIPKAGSHDKLIFTRSVSFKNPSEAATIVLGMPANGCVEWLDRDGKGPPKYPRGFHSKRASLAERLRELSVVSYNCDDDSGRAFAQTLSQLAEQLEAGKVP